MTARDSGLCRIRNISDAGLLIVTSMNLVPQQKVQISLSETISLWGQIAWIDGPKAGINLAHRIDTASLLHRLAAEHHPGVYRARRLRVNATGTLTTEQGIQAVQINNISQQGMQVTQDGNLTTGQLVKVNLCNGLKRYGIVRWTGNGVAGLRLTEPIPVEQLGLDREVSRANEQPPSANTRHLRPNEHSKPGADAA